MKFLIRQILNRANHPQRGSILLKTGLALVLILALFLPPFIPLAEAAVARGKSATDPVADPFWDKTVLLVGNDNNLDTQTSFIDQSRYIRTVTATGNTQYDTAQAPTGLTSSLLFDGTGDSLFSADSEDWNFGSGNFAIEVNLRTTTVTGAHVIVGQYDTSSTDASFLIYQNGTSLLFYATSNGATWDIANGVAIGTLSVNTWYHVVVSRTGNTWETYFDGTRASTFSSSATINNSTRILEIGGLGNNDSEGFNGHLASLKITKGSNRGYTGATITVPSLPLRVGTIEPIVATGGTVTTVGNYKVHTFTSSGTFRVLRGNGPVWYLVVAGGGAGGAGEGRGGGGAGGFRTNDGYTYPVSAGSYTVTVGAGGPNGGVFPSSGSNSVFGTITSLGGGSGGTRYQGAATGGSGGGGSPYSCSSGAAGTPGQGNNGSDSAACGGAGAGGGAGAPGGAATGSTSGNGGAGRASSISGILRYYAGGGGGGNGTGGSGGIGGGGSGAGGGSIGTPNTGGGGGGGENSGGSGVVIIRYPIGPTKTANSFVAQTPSAKDTSFNYGGCGGAAAANLHDGSDPTVAADASGLNANTHAAYDFGSPKEIRRIRTITSFDNAGCQDGWVSNTVMNVQYSDTSLTTGFTTAATHTINGSSGGRYNVVDVTNFASAGAHRYWRIYYSSGSIVGDAWLGELTFYTNDATKINSSQNNRLTDGLVGLWSFDGRDVAEKVYDRSGQGNDGYFIGGATSSAKTVGKIGQALRFGGSNKYISVPDSPNWNFGTGDFTISMWAYWNTFGSDKKYIIHADNTSSYWQLAHEQTTGPYFRIASAGAAIANQGNNTGWSTNVWYLVTLIRSGNTFTIYRNGTSVASGSSASATGDYSAVMTIGGTTVDAPTTMDGKIDDVRIYNRALSAAEVKRLYNFGR